MHYGCVYKLSFPDGTYYIGQTIQSIENRLACHIASSKRGQCPINTKFKNYNRNDVTVEIIEYANSKEELNKKEQSLIWANRGNKCLNKSYNTLTYEEQCQNNKGNKLISIKWLLSEENKENFRKSMEHQKRMINEHLIYNYNIRPVRILNERYQ